MLIKAWDHYASNAIADIHSRTMPERPRFYIDSRHVDRSTVCVIHVLMMAYRLEK